MKIVRLLILLVILFSISCANISQKQNIIVPNNILTENLKSYLNTPSDDPGKIVYASMAIDDLIQIIKSSLKTQDSSTALKASKLAVKIFPFRGDLISLFLVSAKTYKSITLKMAEQRNYDCEKVQKRIDYLIRLVPDEIVKVGSKRCKLRVGKKKELKDYLAILSADDESNSRKTDKNFKNEFDKNLERTILIHNNIHSKLPPIYKIIMSFFKEYGHHKIKFDKFKISPRTSNRSRITIFAENAKTLTGLQNDLCGIICENISLPEDASSIFEDIYHCKDTNGYRFECITSKFMNKCLRSFLHHGKLPYLILKKTIYFSDGTFDSNWVLNDTSDSLFTTNSFFYYKKDLYPIKKCEFSNACITANEKNRISYLNQVTYSIDLTKSFLLNARLWQSWKKTRSKKGFKTVIKNWKKIINIDLEKMKF